MSAAEETSQSAPGIEMAGPTAIRLAIGDALEYELPIDTMEVIGRYNVTIDPTKNLTVDPINLDDSLEVEGDTPIGALDAVARSEGLNYTTYYYTVSDRLVVDSIGEYVYDDDQVWYVLNELNETFHETDTDAQAHNLTDGETFWFIYCDLSDYDPRYESRADRAVAGLSITVTFGEGNVTPTPTVNVTPTENVTPEVTGNVTPTMNVTPQVTGNVTPTGNATPTSTIPGVLIPIPTTTPGNVTPVTTDNVTPGPTENVTPMPTPAGQMDLGEAIGEDGNLSIMAGLISVTDLAATLQNEGPYTVFAPANDAFGNLTPEVIAGILIDDNVRTQVVSNHVVNGSYTAAELLNMTEGGNATTLTTLAGENLTVSESGGLLTIDNATVSTPEINASNGIVHVIDRVLVPPENMTA
ncbi:MAG: fasciclin domain-containing protein [Methanoculleus sp.]|nr:fasciclin domain-containing protein [Methanoculleus sp.]